MFLTLPPPSKIHIIFNYSIGGLPKDETRTVENERGVSMGELADAVWAGLKRATSPGPRANIWDLLDFLDWYPAEERAGLTVRLRDDQMYFCVFAAPHQVSFVVIYP